MPARKGPKRTEPDDRWTVVGELGDGVLLRDAHGWVEKKVTLTEFRAMKARGEIRQEPRPR